MEHRRGEQHKSLPQDLPLVWGSVAHSFHLSTTMSVILPFVPPIVLPPSLFGSEQQQIWFSGRRWCAPDFWGSARSRGLNKVSRGRIEERGPGWSWDQSGITARTLGYLPSVPTAFPTREIVVKTVGRGSEIVTYWWRYVCCIGWDWDNLARQLDCWDLKSKVLPIHLKKTKKLNKHLISFQLVGITLDQTASSEEKVVIATGWVWYKKSGSFPLQTLSLGLFLNVKTCHICLTDMRNIQSGVSG